LKPSASMILTDHRIAYRSYIKEFKHKPKKLAFMVQALTIKTMIALADLGELGSMKVARDD